MYAPRRWRRVGSRAVVAGTEKSGDLNRFLLLLFFVFFFNGGDGCFILPANKRKSQTLTIDLLFFLDLLLCSMTGSIRWLWRGWY
jgi:hypothetical protein